LRKIVIILFLGILTGGCSLSRKASNISPAASSLSNSGNILLDVERQNLTSAGFFIQKAEVELDNQNGKQKFLVSIKFEYPDKYLISLKSRTGIEGARIYISKDSLTVNDRIHKKMYFGTTVYLKRKFGLSQNLLPLVFGDLIAGNIQLDLKQKCFEGNLEYNFNLGGVTLNYNIDCKRNKSSLVTLKSNYFQEAIKLRSEGYLKAGSILVPRVIGIEDLNTNTNIRIRFKKIEYPWYGNLRFIPGKGYELIELL
jgi:hypothetical protein